MPSRNRYDELADPIIGVSGAWLSVARQPSAWTTLPVHSNLLAVRRGGVANAWSGQGSVADIAARPVLPSTAPGRA